jgi:hypothetical protein
MSSIAENIPLANVHAAQAPMSVALRNTFFTLILAVASLGLVGYLWREPGYEMLIVAMGWPHVLLGFSFFLGKVLRGESHSGHVFALLALLTLAICAIHYQYSITGLIYLYFLFHLFRDEIFVYLQTRARHRSRASVYAVAGVAPLILLILLVPKQEAFRHDLRRVEFDNQQIANQSWTLVPFKPVPNSQGRDFYFYVQAPHTNGSRAFITHATENNSATDGELRVSDDKWPRAQDLLFQPHYAGDNDTLASESSGNDSVPVLLTGGHSVGQTFRAQANNLDGIWIPIDRFEQAGEGTRFVFHLASPPLLPYSEWLNGARIALMWILGAIVLWRLLPRRGHGWQLWIYLAVLALAFGGTQTILKSSNNAGYAFPLIFQFAVVFHYWSWYVFSFDKLHSSDRQPVTERTTTGYDRLLSLLANKKHFTAIVIALNVISAVFVLWYYRLGGPSPLRYFFDYNYFLYFLVFHVTFSFRPQLRSWRTAT